VRLRRWGDLSISGLAGANGGGSTRELSDRVKGTTDPRGISIGAPAQSHLVLLVCATGVVCLSACLCADGSCWACHRRRLRPLSVVCGVQSVPVWRAGNTCTRCSLRMRRCPVLRVGEPPPSPPHTHTHTQTPSFPSNSELVTADINRSSRSVRPRVPLRLACRLLSQIGHKTAVRRCSHLSTKDLSPVDEVTRTT